MYKRFRAIKSAVIETVARNDGFGLRNNIIANRSFDFPRSSDKVSAFMDWLAAMERMHILGVSEGLSLTQAGEQAWTRVYIDSSYKRGLASSAQKMRSQGVQVSQGFIDNAFFRPIHADSVGLIYTRTYSDLKGITQTMDAQISHILAQGLAEGRGPLELARQINNRIDKIGITRARMLARTEVIRAHAEATLNAYTEAGAEEVDLEAEILTAGDSRVCPVCKSAERRNPYPLEKARGLIPFHPGCVTGDTTVSAFDVSSASKRWYNGDIVVINTAGGERLTLTPNHPVLTQRGFVSAQEINKFDCLIKCHGVDTIPGIPRIGDNNYIKTLIHNVTETLFSSGKVVPIPVKMTSEDFHGDGSDGGIAIIGADSRLPLNSEMITQFPKSGVFKKACPNTFFFDCFSSFTELMNRNLSSLRCFMRSGILSVSLRLGHVIPFKLFGLGSRSKFDPIVIENFINRTSTNPVSICESLDRHSIKVSFDNVSSVQVRSFAGHVYNLQTASEFYIAENLIVHNCRCSWAPIIKNPTKVRL